MSGSTAVSKDNEWEAEDDARTLMRASEIEKDETRKKRASAVLAKQVVAAQEAANRISLEKKVDSKLKKVLGGNDGSKT